MVSSFDDEAASYDQNFTNTSIGRLQRDRVWDYLRVYFESTDKPLDILELNCGTGEDAIWMAKHGHQILATDASIKMLEESNKKLVIAGLDKLIRTKQLDLTNAQAFQTDRKFDLIFSNFGGLNCLSQDELQSLSTVLKNLLTPMGILVFVVMPKWTVLDSWYRLLKFKWKSRKERRNGFTTVNLNGIQVPCYYYNTDELLQAFRGFELHELKSIGFIPSYFESLSKNHPVLFEYILRFELKSLEKIQSINKADHYLIAMKHV